MLRLVQWFRAWRDAREDRRLGALRDTVADRMRMHLYEEAVTLQMDVVLSIERTAGEYCEERVTALRTLAHLHKRLGQYNRAAEIYSTAFKTATVVFGAQGAEAGLILLDMGLLFITLREYAIATVHLTSSLQILRSHFDESHPKVVLAAKTFAEIGALAAQPDVTGSESYVAKDVLELANKVRELFAEGRYVEALAPAERAFQLSRGRLGARHEFTRASLNSLAGVCELTGRIQEAERLFDHLLTLQIETVGPDDPTTMMVVNNLGSVCVQRGIAERGESLLLRVIDNAGLRATTKVSACNNLAGLYRRQKRFAEAEVLLKSAISQSVGDLGRDHVLTVRSTDNLGTLYWAWGRYAEAEETLATALAISQRTLGVGHPLTVSCTDNLAQVQVSLSNPERGFELMAKVQSADVRIILRSISRTDSDQAGMMLRQMRPRLDRFVSLVLRKFPNSDHHVKLAADVMFRRKGLGVDVVMSQRAAVLEARYPQLARRLQELVAVQGRVQRLIDVELAEQVTAEGQAPILAAIEELAARRNHLQRTLVSEVPELGLEDRILEIDRDVISAALPANSTLIEYLRIDEGSWTADGTGMERYVAFVLRATHAGAVTLYDLGEATEIDRLVYAVRSRASGSRDARSPQAQREPDQQELECLRKVILDPILTGAGRQAYHDDSHRLLLATDGALNLLPFEVLLSDATGAYLTDQYELSYLGTARDLLRGPVRSSSPEGTTTRQSIVVADPRFQLPIAAPAPDEPCGDTLRDLGSLQIRFSPLPGTRLEGEIVAHHLGAEMWTGEDALKGRFKMLQRPWVLHCATHGFFLRSPVDETGAPAAVPEDRAAFVDRLGGPWMTSPMLRSGLALAGCQSWLEGARLPDEAGNGLLTADDVSMIDLRGTEMVVLSACDTAMGVPSPGEGVFGLRRGFVASGARTLIMSLWKVHDLAAVLLMEHFYTVLLNDTGISRGVALQRARQYLRDKVTVGDIRERWLSEDMIAKLSGDSKTYRAQLMRWRSEPDEVRLFRDVRYWGAFILHGDRGPLQRHAP